MGRPSKYTPEIAEEICRRLASGEYLPAICRDPEMPDIATVTRWKHKHPDFRAAYAQAREDRAEIWAEEINAIGDDGSNDYTASEDGELVVNSEHIQRSKLRCDNRKWLLSRLLPKQYGDKTTIAGDLDAPLTIAVRRIVDAGPVIDGVAEPVVAIQAPDDG